VGRGRQAAERGARPARRTSLTKVALTFTLRSRVPGVKDQQRRGGWAGVGLVAQPLVATQRRHRALVQRDLPGLAELGTMHGEHAVFDVEVLVVQADRLPDPQARDGKQPDQRLVGRALQQVAQGRRGCDQRGDVSSGIQVGHRPMGSGQEQAGGWHLDCRVQGVQVGGDAAHHRHPKRQPAPARARRQAHPGHRVLDGDHDRILLFQVVDELGEELGVAFQLEPQGAADPQIVGEQLPQRAHAAPCGHGRAGHPARRGPPWRRPRW